MTSKPDAPPRPRIDAGLVLIAIGILGILWGVFHVLDAAYGPGGPPRTFAERRSYDMVKVDVHRAFFGGLLRAFGGLALVGIGGRLRARRTGADGS